jgi:hypothetical protein
LLKYSKRFFISSGENRLPILIKRRNFSPIPSVCWPLKLFRNGPCLRN